ncbi:MAG: response regulator [Bdellovibrionaceae bacterium]|nr:response regulator [Bdellovibrionales bacterium]MCB9083322.1 response regulator [Pseudobdellovibrionaceae bacterium]
MTTEAANVEVKKWKVLIVDDEELIRSFLEMALDDLDCEIQFAENGNQGFEKALDFRPDLIISDVLMPGGTGESLVRRLREEVTDYRPHVILISGYSHLTDEEAENLGVDKLVAKPFQLDQMVGFIRQVLGLQ